MARPQGAFVERGRSWLSRTPASSAEEAKDTTTVQLVGLIGVGFLIAQELERLAVGGYGHGLTVSSALNWIRAGIITIALVLVRRAGLQVGSAIFVAAGTAVESGRTIVEGLASSTQYILVYVIILAIAALGLPRRLVWGCLALQSAGVAIGYLVDQGVLWPPRHEPPIPFGPAHWAVSLLLSAIILARFGIAVREAFRRAQTAVRLREELATVTAHELRTPVAVLHALLQQLERRATAEAPGERVLRMMDRQVRRLSQLIEMVLVSVDIQSGQLLPELRQVDLVRVAQGVIREAQELGVESAKLVSLTAPEALKGEWDERFVRLILESLLSNALKFGQGRPVEVLVASAEEYSVLEVTDHGIGLPVEQATTLFDRFERGVSSEHYGGMGLGLYVARGLAAALGGDLSVASSPGKGARFTVRLPSKGLQR
jgi:signal transduction histidine kinase